MSNRLRFRSFSVHKMPTMLLNQKTLKSHALGNCGVVTDRNMDSDFNLSEINATKSFLELKLNSVGNYFHSNWFSLDVSISSTCSETFFINRK